VHPFPYNDLETVRGLFERYPDEVACVFMMPFELEPPQTGFLEGVCALSHEHGALFILDEIRSGFRFTLGGAQQFLNLKADLVTLSKAMANGYAVSCIAGRADVLNGVSSTKMTATYFSTSEAMAAALTCIRILRDEDVLDRVWFLGQRLLDGLKRVVTEVGAPATVLGYPPCPLLEFRDMEGEQNERAKVVFFSETARSGLLLHPSHHWYISGAHSVQDIDDTIEICRQALRAACVAI